MPLQRVSVRECGQEPQNRLLTLPARHHIDLRLGGQHRSPMVGREDDAADDPRIRQ